MAPDTDLIRDIGLFVVGIVLFFIPGNYLVILLAAYLLMGFGALHMLFRINLDKTTEKHR